MTATCVCKKDLKRSCLHPEMGTFRPTHVANQNRYAYSILSKTQKSCLVIPKETPDRPYSHIQCFVQSAPFHHFKGLVALVRDEVMHVERERGKKAHVFTEGSEVGWLHVKIQPPSYRTIQKANQP